MPRPLVARIASGSVVSSVLEQTMLFAGLEGLGKAKPAALYDPASLRQIQPGTFESDLGLLALEDFGQSYARTLAAWRQRFRSRIPQVRALGFDDRFIRLWDFYLAYCEGGFRERSIGVAHLLLGNPGYRP